MPHHTSQQPFLFATLPSATTISGTIPRKQSFGSFQSSNVSIVSSIDTIGSEKSSHNGGHSFYNLSKDSNKSNLDLTLPRHHSYPVLYSHANLSNLSISQHNTSGHSIYGSNSNASSSLSLASSQYSVSVDKIHHAFGSLPPPPCPSSTFSASSSSLPLAASVNIPITTPAPTTTKFLSSSCSASLSSRHRATPSKFLNQQHHHHQQPHKVHPTPSFHASLSRSSFSSTTIPLPHTPPQAPSPSLRTLLLPSVAAIGVLPPRKRISNTIPPLNTKTLVQAATLSPSFLSSRSTNMSSTSPSSAGSESLAFGNTYSDISSTTGSIPSSPTRSSPFAAMAITELVISEAHYLTSINRIGNALNKASEADTAAGRKESSTLRCVSDRWAEMTRMHTKFHDDVVAVNDNLRETAGLLNDLLVTLEPVLMDHCRDLSISLKKLIRRDQNSEHTAAEWESALRQPLDHLATYEEWLLRIDPQQNFCKDYISHLQGLIYKFKMVSDSNQHPRNMLRRLSTMARDVIKRRSSVQLLTQGTSAISIAIPESPTSPTTPNSASTQDSSDSMSTVCSPTTPPLSMPETTIMALNIADNDLSIDCTVTKPVSISNDTNNNNNNKSPILREKRLPMIPSDVTQETPTSPQEPGTPIADTFLASPHVKQQQQQQQQKLQHCSSSASALSITGTLATPSTETLVSSSSVSVHSSAETIIQVSQVHQRTNTMTAATTTATCQKFLNDKEARKATLRVGTSESIQAKANSLQSPSFHNNNSASARQTSVETLRRVSPTKTTKAEKPPVKSLISFWEQVSDPLDV